MSSGPSGRGGGGRGGEGGGGGEGLPCVIICHNGGSCKEPGWRVRGGGGGGRGELKNVLSCIKRLWRLDCVGGVARRMVLLL